MRDAAADPAPATTGGMLLLLSCVAIWGVNAVAVKVCTKPPVGPGFDPLFFTGLRFSVVSLCFLPALLVGRPHTLRLARKDWGWAALLGFAAIVLGEGLQPFALRYTSVANLTLLSHGTISLFTAIWALLLFRQPIARLGWVGALVAMAGVGIVATQGSSGQGLRFDNTSLIGSAIACGRALEHSLYLLLLARWMQTHSVLQVTFYNCAFGALWLLPYVLWKAPTVPWSDIQPAVWWSLAWSIVPTTLYGFVAWNWAMRRAGAVAVTNVFYLLPLASAVAAWFLLREPITSGQILGGVVIIIGIVLLRWETLRATGFAFPVMMRLPWRR